MGITQSRIAQIESGVGTAKVTFDILFGILDALGFYFENSSQEGGLTYFIKRARHSFQGLCGF